MAKIEKPTTSGPEKREKKVPNSHRRAEAFLTERMTPLTAVEAQEVEHQEEEGKPRPQQAAAPQTPFNWRETMQEYRQLQQEALQAGAQVEKAQLPQARDGAGGPSIRPMAANRWIPIGPSGARKGQAASSPLISGRVSSIAIAPGGARIYIGAANGGVWRSEDRGQTWTSLMDGFDRNPNSLASDSQAVGAIAIASGNRAGTDTIFVGSGEAIGFVSIGTGTGPYFGVGPIVSTDGGQNWRTEPAAPNSPSLIGTGFYELAVDPTNGNHVLAATPKGLYRRQQISGSTDYHWRRIQQVSAAANRNITGVVAAQTLDFQNDVIPIFFAINDAGGVFRSYNGRQWSRVCDDSNAISSRCLLAMKPNNPRYLYRLTNRTNGGVQGAQLERAPLNTAGIQMDAAFENINSLGFLLGSFNWGVALAVSPDDEDLIFVAGMLQFSDRDGTVLTTSQSQANSDGNWSGAIYRIEPSGSQFTRTYVGGSVHPDIHAVAFPPDRSDELWVGCDGGIFHTRRPLDNGMIFESRNAGLSTLMMHHLAQHPSHASVLFCGSQDNGLLRFTGEAAWLQSAFGDCGYPVIKQNDPYTITTTIQGSANWPLRISTDGGSQRSYSTGGLYFSRAPLFYFPLSGAPRGLPANRDFLVAGSIRPWISDDFGATFQPARGPVDIDDPAADVLPSLIRSIAVVSAEKFYVGTMEGEVYRYQRSGNGIFSREQINRLTPIPQRNLRLNGPITDIAVDLADSSGDSIYITFGGTGDQRHVWHFNGRRWRSRSGGGHPMLGRLLDVQHNAIVVDPEHPTHLYVGADIGVWRSIDSGVSWTPYPFGLPDVAIIDLKIHGLRLLRAATHGRGVYEIRLDEDVIPEVELFVRDTQIDDGRFLTHDGLADPIRQGQGVSHWNGPDIKIDAPDRDGASQFDGESINFAVFTDELSDEVNLRAGWIRADAKSEIYVQIHNRGPHRADNVRVMALITPTVIGLPDLPSDYVDSVRNGRAIHNDNWRTIGIKTVDDVGPIAPKVVSFSVKPDLLGPPTTPGSGQYTILVLVHHEDDVHEGNALASHRSVLGNHKAAMRNVASLPKLRQGSRDSDLSTYFTKVRNPVGNQDDFRLNLQFDDYPGRVFLCTDGRILKESPNLSLTGIVDANEADLFFHWARPHIQFLEAVLSGREVDYDRVQTKAQMQFIEATLDSPRMFEITDRGSARFDGLTISAGKDLPLFVFVEKLASSQGGATVFEANLSLLHTQTWTGAGGQTLYLV